MKMKAKLKHSEAFALFQFERRLGQSKKDLHNGVPHLSAPAGQDLVLQTLLEAESRRGLFEVACSALPEQGKAANPRLRIFTEPMKRPAQKQKSHYISASRKIHLPVAALQPPSTLYLDMALSQLMEIKSSK